MILDFMLMIFLAIVFIVGIVGFLMYSKEK